MRNHKKKGFTFNEFIVAMSIIIMLVVILFPRVVGYMEKANTAKDMVNQRELAQISAIDDLDSSLIPINAKYTISETSVNPFLSNCRKILKLNH